MRPERLAAGTTAHYLSAEYYDRVYRRYTADLPFYLDLAREVGGPVLELGSGTGRVTIPLARQGHEVVGVESSEPMLRAARDKLAREPRSVARRVRLVRGDMRALRLGRRFRLALAPFNVLQHLYTRQDLERCLGSVRSHLMPRAGRLAFDVLVPDVESLARSPGRRYRLGTAYHPAGRKKYLYRESFAYESLSQIQTITLFFDDPDDEAASFATPLCHRQLFPAELEAMIHYNGFRPIDRFGSFEREPLLEVSESQIYVCALRGGDRCGTGRGVTGRAAG